MRPPRRFLLALLTLGLFAVAAAPAAAEPDEPKTEVRLAVVLVFDQMRGDYLLKWDKLFGDGGFRRLAKEGSWFTDCHYPYSGTWTAAGHASLLTGCSPMTHGIIANEWYDRGKGEEVNCVADDRVKTVGRREPASGASASPRTLLVKQTLGDALKEQTGGKARVVALSLKDRAAILPGGRRADACYWFDSATGQFITSTYYRDSLHPPVKAFNAARPADRWFGKKWERLRGDLDYKKHSGADDRPGEAKGYKQGTTFPHPFAEGAEKPNKEYYSAVINSPAGNDLLLELAKKMIAGERLGADDVPDLLCVSFSSNDVVGHCYGPGSQEVLDITLRSDRTVRDLLAYLDAKVGKGRYVVALSADHGVCPTPEAIRGADREADRLDAKGFADRADDFLQEKYGRSRVRAVAALSNHDLYLSRDWLRVKKLTSADVERTLAGWLKKQDVVQTAYTRSELLAGVPKGDGLAKMVRASFHPKRSGDVIVVLKPYYMFGNRLRLGTTHGSPHKYDTHVPLLVSGPGVRRGKRTDRVSPLAVAPILARCLGIKPPGCCDAAVPDNLFVER